MDYHEIEIAIDSLFGRTSAGFDLNEAIRRMTQLHFATSRSSNVCLSVDLAEDLPRTVIDCDRVQSVLSCLFAVAQKSIVESGSLDRAVRVRSEVFEGRVQCSISFATQDDSLRALSSLARQTVNGIPDLSICAGIIQEQGGEFYAWKSRIRAQMTMIIDLPY